MMDEQVIRFLQLLSLNPRDPQLINSLCSQYKRIGIDLQYVNAPDKAMLEALPVRLGRYQVIEAFSLFPSAPFWVKDRGYTWETINKDYICEIEYLPKTLQETVKIINTDGYCVHTYDLRVNLENYFNTGKLSGLMHTFSVLESEGKVVKL